MHKRKIKKKKIRPVMYIYVHTLTVVLQVDTGNIICIYTPLQS